MGLCWEGFGHSACPVPGALPDGQSVSQDSPVVILQPLLYPCPYSSQQRGAGGSFKTLLPFLWNDEGI